MRWSIRDLLSAILCAGAFAGPVDFGMDQFLAAVRESGRTLGVETELSLDPPGSYRIVPLRASVRVTGGDLRGLMYGLLAAADQLRKDGKVVAETAKPSFTDRGVRMAPSDGQLAAAGFFGGDRWREQMQLLAKARINRFTLVLPLALADLDRVRFLSQTAADYGIDFILGLRAPLGDPGSLYASLRQVLDESVLVRGIEILAGDQPLAFYQQSILKAVKEAGRRVTLDIHRDTARVDLVLAALEQGIALRLTEPPGAEAYVELHSVLPLTEPSVTIQQRLDGLAASKAGGFEIEAVGGDLRPSGDILNSWGRLGYDHKTR